MDGAWENCTFLGLQPMSWELRVEGTHGWREKRGQLGWEAAVLRYQCRKPFLASQVDDFQR